MKTLTKEHKEKISQAMSGENHFRYGKTLTQDHKDKISESLMGHLNPAAGKPLSEDHKQKISESCSGYNCKRLNKTVYRFVNHEQKLEFIGNSYDFRLKYNLDNRRVNPLIKGEAISHKGWTCHAIDQQNG